MYENRLRRMAWRQGYELRKSRRRDRRAIDYGRWAIVDRRTDAIVAGAGIEGRYAFTLEDVEAWLTRDEREEERTT